MSSRKRRWTTGPGASHSCSALLIGPVGFCIRRSLPETEAFRNLDKRVKVPIRAVFSQYPRALFIATALGSALNVDGLCPDHHYLPIYAVQNLHMPVTLPFNVLLVSILLRVLTIPLFGLMADRIGGRRMIVGTLALFLVVLYPAYYWIIRPLHAVHHDGGTGFALLIGASTSPIPTVSATLFPTEVRSTRAGHFLQHIAASVFGGFSPFVLTWLLHKTGDS